MMPLHATGRPASGVDHARTGGAVGVIERRPSPRAAPIATLSDGTRLGSRDRVLEQHRDGHRADAARHWRDERARSRALSKVDVADQFAGGGAAIDADIDHHGAGIDPFTADELRLPIAATSIGASDLGRQIARARMADGERGVALEQQERHRLADQVAGSDDDGTRPLEIHSGRVDEAHDAERRARPQAGAAAHQQRLIHRVQAVDVFGGIDGVENRGGVDVRRQRQLHQDTVDILARIQLLHQRQQLAL